MLTVARRSTVVVIFTFRRIVEKADHARFTTLLPILLTAFINFSHLPALLSTYSSVTFIYINVFFFLRNRR